VNHARQAVDEGVDDTPAVHPPLRAGEFSLHRTLILHRSQPDRSLGRRIGLGLSDIPTHVGHVAFERSYEDNPCRVRGTGHDHILDLNVRHLALRPGIEREHWRRSHPGGETI
jgi:hypothetical protein